MLLRAALLLALVSGCNRTDLRGPKQRGDDCLDNAECPEACIGQRCATFAGGGQVCDDPEDCVAGFQCPDGFCRGEEGVGCSSNDECLEACINGGCTTPSSAGGPCDQADDCVPGHECTAGTCSPPVPPSYVRIEPGLFTMGSPATEEGRQAQETQHEVTLIRAFYIQETELTQTQFEAVMGWNPSHFIVDCGGDCPVEQVSWYDMVATMNELSLDDNLMPCYAIANVECVDLSTHGTDYMACMNAIRGGISSATVALNNVSRVVDCEGYRLPTEAEWEFAARAHTTTATHNGDLTSTTLVCEQPNNTLDPVAWFCGNSSTTTHAAASLTTNAFGLYDMLGNVWEWCWDWHAAYPGDITNPEGAGTGSERVIRGASWYSDAAYTRAAHRGNAPPDSRLTNLGGRPSRSAF